MAKCAQCGQETNSTYYNGLFCAKCYEHLERVVIYQNFGQLGIELYELIAKLQRMEDV